jgi:peptide/nickel transport system permease protein
VGAYLVRRSLRTAIVLVVASIAVFYGLRVAPGDPTAGVLSPTVAEEVREAYRERLGLNEPVWVQYGVYL